MGVHGYAPNLHALSAIQLEDAALAEYGGFQKYLFVPNSAGNDWQLNNQAAQDYANSIRNVAGGVCQ